MLVSIVFPSESGSSHVKIPYPLGIYEWYLDPDRP